MKPVGDRHGFGWGCPYRNRHEYGTGNGENNNDDWGEGSGVAESYSFGSGDCYDVNENGGYDSDTVGNRSNRRL